MDHESHIITPGNKPFIATRFLPKTGQTISYQAGDDGTYENGWSIGSRFVAKVIGGEDIVFDRATGLMWAGDQNAAGGNAGGTLAWAACVLYCNFLNFAGFTDWRLPNRFELASIVDHSIIQPCTPPVFQNIPSGGGGYHWSSTTNSGLTSQAYRVQLCGVGVVLRIDKATLHHCLAVRKGSPG